MSSKVQREEDQGPAIVANELSKADSDFSIQIIYATKHAGRPAEI